MTIAQLHAQKARDPGVGSSRVVRTRAALAAVLSVLMGFMGCAPKPDLVAPAVLVSPYAGGNRPVVWAVAPLSNESGTSAVDPLAVSDAIVARAAEARGLAVLPLNRTLAAMRALGMNAVRSPGEARRLAAALDADAIIVGSVTAYDPYDPPTLGLMLGLYSRLGDAGKGVDPKAMRSAATDGGTPGGPDGDAPLAVVSEHLDAHNHEVLMNLRRYAEGRHDPKAALGWRQYTASMELYTEFAAYWSVHRLLQEERLRVSRSIVAGGKAPR